MDPPGLNLCKAEPKSVQTAPSLTARSSGYLPTLPSTIPAGPSGVDPVAALRAVRALGLRSVLVEGGARVITSLLSGGLVDRVIVSVSPTLIGAGREAVGDLGVGLISEGLRLEVPSVHQVGGDLVIAGGLRAAESESPSGRWAS